MAIFGQLEIRYPNGNVEHAYLTGESVSLGRGRDNSVVIQDELIAPRHCELRLASGVVYLINRDSRMGTRIAGTTLRDSQPIALPDTTEFHLGSTSIVFRAASDQLTVPMASLSEQTLPVVQAIEVALTRQIVEVFPASNASLEIILTNHLTESLTCDIEIDGLPEDWAKLSRSTVALAGGERSPVYLIIEPARSPEISPADYPVVITVRAHNATLPEIRREATVRLREYGGLSLALDPQLVENGDAFHLYLLNQGNESLRLILGIQHAEDDLHVELSERAVELRAGQRIRIEGRATGKRKLGGVAHKRPFAVLAQAENASRYLVAIPAQVLLRPYLSRLAIASIALVLAAIAIVLGARLSQPPPPVISSLELSASEVASGTPVELRWQSSDAQRFVIEVDGVATAELTGDSSSYVLTTDSYVDPIEVVLLALSGEETTTAVRTLTVYQPVTIYSFAANRSLLRRHVNERILIDWQVEGAVALDLPLPTGFDVISDVRQPDGRGQIILLGTPNAGFDLRLLAEDERGNLAEQVIEISVVDPECTATGDIALFEGPDLRYPQTATAIEGVPVLVSGIDGGRTWLQVELASGEIGWGDLGSFRCDGFEPGTLEVISEIPPLPTATATATVTASPTSTTTSTDTPTPVNSATSVFPTTSAGA